MIYCREKNQLDKKDARVLLPDWGLYRRSIFSLSMPDSFKSNEDHPSGFIDSFNAQRNLRPVVKLKSQTGFTLIEIMVVMVIISLAATMIVLSLPSPPPEIRKQAEQLVARLNMVSDTAQERGTMTGVEMSFQGYRFAARKLGGWVDNYSLGEPGIIYPWPEDVRINLEVDGNAVSLENQFDPTVARSPDLYFTPDGLQPPFTLMLSVKDEKIIIQGTPEGKLKMVDPKAGRR